MKNRTLLTVAFLIAFVLTSLLIAQEKRTIYVSASAAASNADGSQIAPFPSLEAARDYVRTLPKDRAIEVIVQKGIYSIQGDSLTFDQRDSGTAEFPILWRGEGAVLTGGQRIDSALFQPVTDPEILARLDSEAKDHILCVDLNAVSLPSLPPLKEFERLPVPLPELYFNGETMPLATWPNEGWSTIEKYTHPLLDIEHPEIKPTDPTEFIYADETGENRPARWLHAPEVYLHGFWQFDWNDEVMQVDKIDPEKKTIALKLQHHNALGYRNPAPRRWQVINLLEEIDVPGEYCYDSTLNRLYFYPPKEIENAEVTIDLFYRPIIELNQADHLTFQNFTFTGCFDHGMSGTDSSFLTIDQCTFRNIRRRGIVLSSGTNNTIKNSLFEEIGSGGIFLLGGDCRTLAPSGTVIENNLFRRFSKKQLCYSSAIGAYGVGFLIRHNEISESPHMAVGMSTNDSIFEYNIVHDVCLSCDDCGAFYKGRNPAQRGNQYRYNYWYNIGTERGHGNAAIYLDDGDGGEDIYGNLFINAGQPANGDFGAIFSHGGHDNHAWNNLFIDCRRAIGSAPWTDDHWKHDLAGEDWQRKLLQEVDITQPLYVEHYPELANFMAGAPMEKRVNYADRNLIIGQTKEVNGNWQFDDTNWVTDQKDFFVDPEHGDYTMKPDSEPFQKIPGFEPIPFYEMGIQPKGFVPGAK